MVKMLMHCKIQRGRGFESQEYPPFIKHLLQKVCENYEHKKVCRQGMMVQKYIEPLSLNEWIRKTK